MAFYPLEKLINLEEGYKRQFNVGRHTLLLVVEQGQYFLCEASCPHLAAPLIQGRVTGGKIQCLKHGFEFDLSSGQHTQAQQTGCRALNIFPVCYQGDTLGVDL